MPRVYLFFFVRGSATGSEWVCNFLETDLQRPIGRIRTYASVDIVLGLIERGHGFPDFAARQAVDDAIRHGRGDAYLQLTDAQYAKLKR